MANSVAFSDEISSFSPIFSSLFDNMMSSPPPPPPPSPPPPPPPSFDQKASSFGSFKDLLTIQDFNPALFDWYPTTTTAAATTTSPPPSATQISHPLPSPATSNIPHEYSSEVLNNTTPTTPNSSSISSSPNGGAVNELAEPEAEDDEDQDQNQIKNELMKEKKQKKQKKEKEPRYAFMTRSDVDHLDDGYRWRKYGQKAVKNSPHPRSYYRCTTPQCGVKKRVERSFEDTSIVITTYEGVHTHPCPAARASHGFGPTAASASYGGGAPHHGLGSNHYVMQPPQHHVQQFQNHQNVLRAAPSFSYNNSTTSSLNVANPAAPNSCFNASSSFGSFIQGNNGGGFGQSSRFMANNNNEGLLRDNGLLHDMIVPTHMEIGG